MNAYITRMNAYITRRQQDIRGPSLSIVPRPAPSASPCFADR